MVLQGPNLGLAVKKWAETLRWPQNLDQKDVNDWGISWFEMTVSFYLFSGMLFPIRISGSGGHSKYVQYDSAEAVLLPHTKRSGAQQALCFRNIMQNLTTLLGDKFFLLSSHPDAALCIDLGGVMSALEFRGDQFCQTI